MKKQLQIADCRLQNKNSNQCDKVATPNPQSAIRNPQLKHFSLFVLFAIFALTLTSSCIPTAKPSRPLVACSISPQAYFLKQLLAADVEVLVLLPPGASAESFEPTMLQMKTLPRAKIYFAMGHPHFSFEQNWLPKMLSQNPTIKLHKAQSLFKDFTDDPHVWLSPLLMITYVDAMAKELKLAFPQLSPRIDARQAKLSEAMFNLHTEIQATLRPYAGRTFLVFHPAWSYFAKDYGVKQLAIENEHKSPSPRQLQLILNQAQAEKINTIFVQPAYDVKIAQAAAETLHAQLATAEPMEADWFKGLRQFTILLVQSWQ